MYTFHFTFSDPVPALILYYLPRIQSIELCTMISHSSKGQPTSLVYIASPEPSHSERENFEIRKRHRIS